MTKPIGPLSFSNYFKVSSTVLPKVNKIKGQAASFFQKLGASLVQNSKTYASILILLAISTMPFGTTSQRLKLIR